jgi:hypothetical protein
LREPTPAPIAPGKKKLAPRAKAAKAAPDKDKVKDKTTKSVKETSGPKATRVKKAKAE